MSWLSRRSGRHFRSLVGVLAFGSGAVHAADNGLYLGASVAAPSTDYDWRLDPRDLGSVNEGTGFKIVGGMRPLDPLAIEINYVDFGNTVARALVVCITLPCPDRLSLDVQALSVSAVGLKSFRLVDMFARAGISRWEANRDLLGAADKQTGTDATYGVGAQLRLGSLALRLEYERFRFSGGSANQMSLGFTYTFY